MNAIAGISTYSGTYINLLKISFGKYRGKKQFKLQGREFEMRETGFKIGHMQSVPA